MRFLFLFAFLLFSVCGFPQTISAPSPLTIEANASNVDAGDFVITWPNSPPNILVSVSLEYQSDATISFPINTGLTRNTGYNTWNGISSIVFYGSLTNINTALSAMTISMGSLKTAIRINIEVSSYDANYKYNPINKHFYRFVSGNVSYATALSNAGASMYNFKGKTGYLVTITDQQEQNFLNNNIDGNNIWIALTDATVEGTWKIDAGPELGTTIKTQNGQTAGNISGQFNNWCSNEPNNSNNEDFAVTKWNGGNCWNDVNGTATVGGYIIEISSDFPSGSGYTDVYSSYIVHNNNSAFSLNSATGLNSTSISNLQNLDGRLQVNAGHVLTLRSGHTLNTNRIDLDGSGKIIFSDASTKWKPSVANSLGTFIHSPNSNSNPIYWDVSSRWVDDLFASSGANHYTPYLNSGQGWSAKFNDAPNQWIILNYDIPTYIAGIVTQARANNFGQLVTGANIDVSIDGLTWRRVMTGAILNNNQTDAVSVFFPNLEYAKFVKVIPTTYTNHISMRLGLIIKSNKITTDGLVLHLDAGNLSSYIGTGIEWKDLTGNSINATLNNVTYNTAGYFVFNGINNSSVNFTANIGSPSVITVEMWVKTISLGGMLFGFNVYDVWTANNNLGFNTAAGDQYGIPSSQVTTLGILNNWKHFVFVMNQGTTVGNKIYVNGISQILSLNSGLVRSGAAFNSGIGRISSWSYDYGWLMNMQVANFRVYKRELTQQDILDNYNAEKSRFGL
jgi:hypothetical protein